MVYIYAYFKLGGGCFIKLINNRYRIIDRLNESEEVAIYLCSDMWDGEKPLKVTIIQKKIMTDKLKKFYIENFIALRSMDNDNIIKNSSFDRVSEIDNRTNIDEQYLYTSEYIKNPISLLDYIEDKSAFENIKVSIDICKSIHYLHINGYVYGGVSLDKILFAETEDGYQLKLKDLAAIKLKEEMFSETDIANDSLEIFKSNGIEFTNRRFDMYSLGILFINMITKGRSNASPDRILQEFRESLSMGTVKDLTNKEIDVIIKIIPIIEKLLSLERVYPYRYIYEFIDEINIAIDGNYSLADRKKAEKLNSYNKLVGREFIIDTINKAYKNMVNYKNHKNIFFIEGNSGIGKTRLLKEIDFLLRLDGAKVYSSFKLKNLDDDIEVLEEIFNNMLLDWDKDKSLISESKLSRMNRNEVDFKSIGFKKVFNDPSNKDRLLNKMTGFIIDTLKNKQSIIIIDNINLANEFTIDIIKYIYSEIIRDKNVILIFSYKYDKVEQNKNIVEFIEYLKRSSESSVFKLDNFNEKETGKMIQNILSMDHVPTVLSKRVYEKSYGNPLFITEIIKELYSSRRLFRKEESGLWHIDIEKGDTEYKRLEIPNNLEQALLNQIEDITYTEKIIINTISIFFNPISLENLDDLIGLDRNDLERGIAELLNKGVLSRSFRNRKDAYEINNKVLSDLVYDKIPEKVRIQTHKLASELLERKIRNGININLDELIYHLDKSLERDKARLYLIQNSKDKYDLRNIAGAIEDLNRAINYIETEEISEKLEILFKKADMCIEIESVKEAMDTIEVIEGLNLSAKDPKVSLKLNILKTEMSLLKGELSEMKHFLDKSSELLERIEDLESELRCNIFKAIMLFIDGDLDKSMWHCRHTIDRCGNIYIRTKGDAYRILALIYTRLNRLEEAIELNKVSIELLQAIGYTRGVIYATNNIGAIYKDNYQDLDKALEYHEKTLSISKDHKLVSGELLALSNIGSILYDMYDYDLAYGYFNEALKKALEADYKEETIHIYRQLTILCLDKGYYSKAYDYYSLARERSEEDDRLLDELKIYRGEVYYNLGAFEKALYWTETGLDYIQDTISAKYKYTIRCYLLKILVNQIKVPEINDYVEKIIDVSRKIEVSQIKITELSKIAESLYRKGDRGNADKIFIELEKTVDKNVDEKGRGYYHYIKGILSSGFESMNSLEIALKLAKKHKNKLLTANTKIEIANYYYDKKDCYNAVNYYVGAAQIIRNIIYDIPDRYKLEFVNNYYYVRFHYRLSNLMNILLYGRDDMGEITERFKADSLEELWTLLSTDYNVLAGDKSFIDRYRENYLMARENKVFKNKNIIDDLDNDLLLNLDKIMEYLSDITLATKAHVIIEEDENLIVVASLNGEDKQQPSKYVFERLKVSMKPILISTRMILNEYDASFLRGDLKAGIYIPITSGYSNLYIKRDRESNNKNLKIIGYIYLETENTINNFNEEILAENRGLVNLVSILCEKYKLIRMSTIDKLTGALTRKYLEDSLEDLVRSTKRDGGQFSIIMYDLDRFKRINDKFGHQAGDEILRKVSELVMDNIDSKSSLGRYGGEEFVIILPGIGAEEALRISNDLKEKISSSKLLGDLLDVCISSGVAGYPAHGTTSHELIEKADQALYSAKENGRNKSEVWKRNIAVKTKPISKLDGIITGDDIRDSRNVLALVETMELMNSSISKSEKIDSYLVRLIETLEAEYGYLLILEEDKIVKSYKKKSRKEEGADHFCCNETIVDDIIRNRQGVYKIDWNHVKKTSAVTSVPVWSSILAVPIIQEDKIKAVIYLIVSTNSKEFGVDDLNFANIYGNLFHL